MIIPDDEIKEEFFRPASGAGGQKVNKTENGVRLIYDFGASSMLDDGAKARLRVLGGANASGDRLVIVSHASRSLTVNRDDARNKLEELVAKALVRPKKRKKTKATKSSVEKRLASKARRSAVKKFRSKGGKSGLYD